MPQTFQMSLSTKFSLPTIHTETTTPLFKPQNLNFLNVGLRQYQIPSYSTRGTFVSRGKNLLRRKCSKNNGDSSAKEDDDQALQAVLKLYNAIKNKNICELSEIFGDESRCWCNFIPFFHSFRGKEVFMNRNDGWWSPTNDIEFVLVWNYNWWKCCSKWRCSFLTLSNVWGTTYSLCFNQFQTMEWQWGLHGS